jgi:hypothetical protein
MMPLVILNHSDGEVTCCPMNDPLFNCTLRFFPELAEEYVDSCFWEKNIPTLNELVLVQREGNFTLNYDDISTLIFCSKFCVDCLWYRALVFDCCSGSVDVLFIDFGDSEKDVAFSRVRKLPFELKNAPVLGMQATVIGKLS